ncbi:MAG: ABC transporter ATP-binding protein/permease [Chloroflexota bacterium]|nr:ABC transporter ATP-binding protein/permease [Chloroflexota bacterium]
MRERWRGLAVLLGFSFRAAPRQTVLLFLTQLGSQVGALAGAYGIKLLTDAIVRGDASGAVRSGVFIALTEGAGYMCRRFFYLSREVEDRTGLLVDQRLMALTTGIAGIEHHERPQYSNQVELLRSQRGVLAGVTSSLVYNLRSFVRFIGSAILLSQVSPWLLLLVLLGFPSGLAGRVGNAIQERASEANAERGRLRRHLLGLTVSAGAAKELRVFDLGEAIIARHRALAIQMTREELRAAWKSRAVDLVGGVVFVAGFIAALVLVLLRAIDGQATAGDVLLTLRLAADVTTAVEAFTGGATYLLRALKAAGRYLWLVDYASRAQTTRPAPAAPAEPTVVPERLTRGIELERLSFRYPGTDHPVLHDVSLVIPAGSVVAIVGENGAGKTTLVKLLCRFYEPESGRILVDGVDLRHHDGAGWRRRIGAGFQDFCRFEFLAQETVGVGDLPYVGAPAHVGAALARADATDVLASLPNGLRTQLGRAWDEGVDLSGGQWQKLALARGFMRQAPLLLILDEPTAAIDAPTEHALFERFATAGRRGEREGSITLVVSHRFSTVRMADLILVMDDGTIVDSGSHAQLMEHRGLYAELYTLQASAYHAGPREDNR